MKIQTLTSGLITALVLASPIAGAEDYPAANFEPTVIYSSVEAEPESSKKAGKSQADDKYPAANFEPTVIYSSDEAKQSESAGSKKAEKSVADSNYPAANFEPTVLFVAEDAASSSSDSSAEKVASKSTSSAASDESSDSAEEVTSAEEVASAEEAEESMVTLFGLMALAIVGFVLLKKKACCPKKSAPKARHSAVASAPKKAQPAANGSTGVARYLNKNMPEISTVAKYLQNKGKVQVSGVSKYMARKVVSAKAAAVAKTTGVEKYLRNKG